MPRFNSIASAMLCGAAGLHAKPPGLLSSWQRQDAAKAAGACPVGRLADCSGHVGSPTLARSIGSVLYGRSRRPCLAPCAGRRSPVRLPRDLPAQPSYAGRGEEEPYAVVEVAGHQIVAQPNRLYTVAHLRVAPGTELRLPRVLLLRRETEVLTGRPYVWGRWVGVRVVEHVDGPEITVTKFKRKKHYLRRKVHVQRYTRILVTDIEGEGELEEEGAGDTTGVDRDGAEDLPAGGEPLGPPVPRLPPLVFPVLPAGELDRRLSVAKAWLDGKPLLTMTQAAMRRLREEHEAEGAARD